MGDVSGPYRASVCGAAAPPAGCWGGKTVKKLAALSAISILTLSLAVIVTAQPALAVNPCGTGGVFAAGATDSCTYTTAGDDTFTVPGGVASVTINAIGAPGGDPSGTGAKGAAVAATMAASALASGSPSLYVEVGGSPGNSL